MMKQTLRFLTNYDSMTLDQEDNSLVLLHNYALYRDIAPMKLSENKSQIHQMNPNVTIVGIMAWEKVHMKTFSLLEHLFMYHHMI